MISKLATVLGLTSAQLLFTNLQEQSVKGELYTFMQQNPNGFKDDGFLDRLLISTRTGVNHLLYDEVMRLCTHILESFPDVVTKESIGKTYEGRDIWMLKINATPHFTKRGLASNPDKKAILLTGAHHSRELVSVQMPLYTTLEILHGLVHNDAEALGILRESQIFVIPVVNIDGFYTIYEHWMQTGELLLKRKNNDRSNEGNLNCELRLQGVDINRNYGYLWGND